MTCVVCSCTCSGQWTACARHVSRCGVLDADTNLHAGYFSFDKPSGVWSLELDGTRCALHYLKRWCLIDIASIIPFDLFLLARSSSHRRRNAALLRLPRALKLLRLPRFFRCGVPLHTCMVSCRGVLGSKRANQVFTACCICERLCKTMPYTGNAVICLLHLKQAHGRCFLSAREGHVLRCRYLKKWQQLIPVSSIMMQLGTCICVMMLFAHIAACMLVIAAQLEGMPPECWLVFNRAQLLSNHCMTLPSCVTSAALQSFHVPWLRAI